MKRYPRLLVTRRRERSLHRTLSGKVCYQSKPWWVVRLVHSPDQVQTIHLGEDELNPTFTTSVVAWAECVDWAEAVVKMARERGAL